MRSLLALAMAGLLVSQAAAISVSWTGYAKDNQWTTAVNWYPAQVPGVNDDVTISKGIVICTIETGVASLGMGDSFEAPANLTIFNQFFVGSGGMTVQGNGNLIIGGGNSQVSGSGQINVAGTVQWIAGAIGGSWTISNRATLNAGNQNEKALIGAGVQMEGTMLLGGVLVLNQSSVLTVTGTVKASTDVHIQAQDSTAVSFDASKGTFNYCCGDLSIQAPVKLGTFGYTSGNLTLYSTIAFHSVLSVPEQSYVTTLGSAEVSFGAGLTGKGVVSASSKTTTFTGVNMTGYLNAVAGAVLFGGENGNAVGVLSFAGANVQTNTAVAAQQLNLLGGQVNGAGAVTASSVLLKSQGFDLGNSLTVTGTMTADKSSLIWMTEGNLKIARGGVVNVVGALELTGPAFLNGGLQNDGTVNVKAALTSQNINVVGAGACNVDTTMSVNNAKFTQKTVALSKGGAANGANTFLSLSAVTAPAEVKGTMGPYSLTCPKECDDVTTKGSTAPAASFMFIGA
jgi:hypothetical protein